MDADAMILIMDYKDYQGEERPVLMAFKHGLSEEELQGRNFPNMKIYKDVFSGDELFSNNYPMKLVDDCLYEVYGNFISLTEGADGDEGGDVVDLVLNHRLTETGFRSKSDFWVYFKDYLQKLVKYLERNDRASEVNVFRMNINNVMKELLGKFKDLQFFTGNKTHCRRCSVVTF